METQSVKAVRERIGSKIKRWFERAQFRAFDRALAFLIDRHPGVLNSSLVRYAENELRLAGYFEKSGFYGDMLGHAVLRQVKIFSLEGHSGMSAGIASDLAKHVIMFRPLVPLTGEDSEWNEIREGVFQNRRYSSIFKENGQAYRIDGKVFRAPDGGAYTSRASRVPVTFPWQYSEPDFVDVEDCAHD